MRSPVKYLIYIGMVVTLSFVPFFLASHSKWITVLTFANFYAIFTMSWDILSGYTGQISFGHAFFIGVAGCTSALLNVHLDMPIWITMPLGVIAAVLMGVLIAVPALRLRGPYFALVTLLLPIVAIKLIGIFHEYTGGVTGRYVADPLYPIIIGTPFKVARTINYYYSLGLMLLVAIGLLAIARSKIGKIFEAIRENEEAVEAAGINTAKFKVLAFVISSFVAGLGGAFYVHFWKSLIPNTILSLQLSVELIIASVVGGMGTIIGPIVGSYFLKTGQEYIRGVARGYQPLSFLKEWDMLIFLLILILLIFFARRGVVPTITSLTRRIFPAKNQERGEG